MDKVMKAIFAAAMTNAHISLKLLYKMKGREVDDQQIEEEVSRQYEKYFSHFVFPEK